MHIYISYFLYFYLKLYIYINISFALQILRFWLDYWQFYNSYLLYFWIFPGKSIYVGQSCQGWYFFTDTTSDRCELRTLDATLLHHFGGFRLRLCWVRWYFEGNWFIELAFYNEISEVCILCPNTLGTFHIQHHFLCSEPSPTFPSTSTPSSGLCYCLRDPYPKISLAS